MTLSFCIPLSVATESFLSISIENDSDRIARYSHPFHILVVYLDLIKRDCVPLKVEILVEAAAKHLMFCFIIICRCW